MSRCAVARAPCIAMHPGGRETPPAVNADPGALVLDAIGGYEA
jgi:hypothetical protein